MVQEITTASQNFASQPLGLAFAFMLGLLSTATSACCIIPALGILLGYSGATAISDRKEAIKTSVFFTLGTIFALVIVGLIAGFIGQIAQNTLGKYWKLFAGIIALIFGLATLNLFPLKLPSGTKKNKIQKSGIIITTLAGIVMGGIVAISSLPCNPGIFIVIGAAILQGKLLWPVLLLAIFAAGFSIPLGAILLGFSVGRASFIAKKADSVLIFIAGCILLVGGFYFLLTF